MVRHARRGPFSEAQALGKNLDICSKLYYHRKPGNGPGDPPGCFTGPGCEGPGEKLEAAIRFP